MAWNWEYDADLVRLLEACCGLRGVSLLAVTPQTLDGTLWALDDEELSFRVLLDRASDTDERFVGLVDRARRAGAYRINSYELARYAWDKAAMHDELSPIVPTPNTIVLPPYAEQPELPSIDLAPIGERFLVKPAHGGGGVGVVRGATTAEQVQAARQEYPADKYLIQSHVAPAHLGDRPAWFRVISCTGQVFPCWWHPETHVYSSVTPDEEASYGLHPLRAMAHTIARFAVLEVFSTEIALTPAGEFVVVDYVNDPIDLRLQSRAGDGVPDHIVQAVAARLVDFAARCCDMER